MIVADKNFFDSPMSPDMQEIGSPDDRVRIYGWPSAGYVWWLLVTVNGVEHYRQGEGEMTARAALDKANAERAKIIGGAA
jgi:hypothetical protein